LTGLEKKKAGGNEKQPLKAEAGEKKSVRKSWPNTKRMETNPCQQRSRAREGSGFLGERQEGKEGKRIED